LLSGVVLRNIDEPYGSEVTSRKMGYLSGKVHNRFQLTVPEQVAR